VTGNAELAANVVTVTVQAGRIDDLAKLPGVVSVKPVSRYQTTAAPAPSGSLAQAADYLGVSKVRARGIDGRGVKIAVLDSGIDYTHRNLGGPGTVAAYEACYAQRDVAPTGECAALFGPGAPKVKGGYDFVGDTWTGAAGTPALAPDSNPIDFEGHGTHVADIAAGRSADGKHLGLAPGADLYGVKVCSSISTSCSGPAILAGIDWSMDPNGDGDISDAMDIVNLSLGSDYGLPEDDSTSAIENLVRTGIVAVISAGNGSDRPFKVGSPSTADSAISVAQTALPDNKIYPITVDSPVIPGLPDNTVRYAVAQPWAPVPSTAVSGRLAVPSDPLGCSPADFASFPSGAVALIRRGTCNASAKAQNAQAAGAIAVIIYNNVPGDPPSFSFGGGPAVTIPTLTISQARGQQLAAAVAAGEVRVTIDPAKAQSLVNTTVGTSSRGPRILGSTVKPDIGAPGAWLSAEVGTGDEETSFGGTSGAAPVVTGIAALVLQAHPRATPYQVKARLLNGADTGNTTLDADANPYATPVSRIGAGEVRADTAVFARGLLENRAQANSNVGLGQPHLTRPLTRVVRLQLTNTARVTKAYTVSTTFREAADQATGAVVVRAPSRVVVRGGRTATVPVRITIDPAKLPKWPFTFTAGSTGAGEALNAPEFDGLIIARSRQETLHLGWHVLPHRSADVSAPDSVRLRANDTGTLRLVNRSGVLAGTVDVFGLTGTSGQLPPPTPGGPGTPGSNQAVIDLRATGVRDDADEGLIQFAIASQQRQTSPLYPAGFEVLLDTDRNGTNDYLIYNTELGGAATSGQSVVAVQKLVPAGAATPVSYVITDFDSSTRVYTVPLQTLGLSRGSRFNFTVNAYDNYNTGIISDSIAGQSWTVGAPRYTTTAGDTFTVPELGVKQVGVVKNPRAGTSSQTGLLLLFADARVNDFRAVEVQD
jgi:subtilisin family serine protease